jgi:hypothetical protein
MEDFSMSYMFEVHYRSPACLRREAELTAQVSRWGGRLSYREEANGQGTGTVTLTFEFSAAGQAEEAAALLREKGELVEGPMDYGD